MKAEKCVIVLDDSLPAGVLANTAAILGITLGKMLPGMVGRDVCDRSGRTHPGIIEFPVPILRCPAEGLKNLREQLYSPGCGDVIAVDFSDLAQSCKNYADFMEKMAAADGASLSYLGLALCGARRQVNHLTGSLPLLR